MSHQIFEQSFGLILDISMWSGSKSLRAEDFQGVELPPEELVSLGSKRLHDKEAFKPVNAVRSKAATYLSGVAVSLYGGKIWIVPEHRLNEVELALADLANEFETEKQLFLQGFLEAQDQWLNKNQQWVNILRPYLDTPESIAQKFEFKWRIFKMSSVEDDPELAETLAGDMTNTLLREISHLSAEAYSALKNKDKATTRNLNRLDKLVGKLKGMSFVNPAMGAIEQELEQILDQRDEGVLSGNDLFSLLRLLVQLKNPKVLREVLDAASSGDGYDFNLKEQTKPVVEQVSRVPTPKVPKAPQTPKVEPQLPVWF
jgi:hypothetical protein